MALVPALPHSTSLSDALQEFRDGLSVDNKRHLVALNAVPDANDVLAFTAQLDRANAVRRRRGVASRFVSLLLSVQQYSAIMDTYSQVKADTTSLVWGSIKLTIHIVNSVSTYFDKLSEWFMRLGTACPRYSEYHSIFSQSTGLQKALDAFFATVVRFCGKAIQVMERSGLVHFVVSIWKPFEVEFAVVEADLKRLNHEVVEEIRLATARAASMYQSSGQSFRQSMTLWREKETARNLQIDEYKSRSRKQQLLDGLSKHDYYSPFTKYRKERHGATCAWISSEPTYRQWLENAESSVFWLSGGIGTGKSVLTAAVVDDLLCRTSPNGKAFMSFFFCRDDNAESLLASVIIGSLVRACLTVQILDKNLEDSLARILPRRSSLDADDMAAIFVQASNLTDTHYIVLDGLDECCKTDRAAVLRVLRQVSDTARSTVKVFLSCRDDVGDDVPRVFPNCYKQLMSRAHVDADIATFVEDVVQGRVDDGELAVGDVKLLKDISAALVGGADGMFLWVIFQLNDICEQTCDDGIRNVIGTLPKGLSGTYRKALSRVVERGKADVAERVFRWAAVARRPLTLEELREVLYIEPGQASFRHDRLVNNIHNIVRWCGNLVTVDEEDRAVRFAHHTIKQYLCSDGSQVAGDGGARPQRFRIALPDADHTVGEVCVTYLNFSDFQQQLARPLRPITPPAATVSPTSLAEAAIAANLSHSVATAVSGVARLLWSSPSQQQSPPAEVDVMSRIGNAQMRRGAGDDDDTKVGMQHYAFFAYAEDCWLHHTTRFSMSTSITWDLWVSLVLRDERFASLRHGMSSSASTASHNDGSELEPLVDSVLQYNHQALLGWLLKTYDPLSPGFGPLKSGMLTGIATDGKHQLLELLIRKGSLSKVDLGVAMVIAARRGHIQLVRTLLKAGADINYGSSGLTTHTALQAAAGGGHFQLVQLLLLSGANVDAQQYGSRNGSTALQAAAGRGFSAIVDVLLAAGADVNAPPTSLGGRTALQAAAEGGHLTIVRRLLQAGASVNARPADHAGQTALQAAAAAGHRAVVELLVASGANINAPLQPPTATSALAAASMGGHVEIVELLLEAGADPNQPPTRYGRTALQAAMSKGHQQIVDRLLEAGADVGHQTLRHRRTQFTPPVLD